MSGGGAAVGAQGGIPGPAVPGCFGPYLRYAISTNFTNFESFDDATLKLFLLVAFKQPGTATAFAGRMRQEAGILVDLGPDSDHGRHATAFTGSAGVRKPEALAIWEDCVDRVELSLPIEPVARRPQPLMLRRRRRARTRPGGLLIGLLDDGCPFAAAQFLRGPTSTRVRSIWDQSRSRKPVSYPDGAGAPILGEVPKAIR